MTDDEMAGHLLPENELARLNALSQYDILDTPDASGFDTLTILAAAIFESEYAHICFVGKEHAYFKASTGNITVIQTDRKNSLCSASISNKNPTVLYHTHEFSKEISFYAAAPIITREGFVLGTIAVTDSKPHQQVTDQQLKMLQMLADLVMEKLEIRLSDINTLATYNERLRTLAHDIKNPVTSISLYAQLLSAKEMQKEKVFSMAERIENSIKRIEETLNNLFM